MGICVEAKAQLFEGPVFVYGPVSTTIGVAGPNAEKTFMANTFAAGCAGCVSSVLTTFSPMNGPSMGLFAAIRSAYFKPAVAAALRSYAAGAIAKSAAEQAIREAMTASLASAGYSVVLVALNGALSQAAVNALGQTVGVTQNIAVVAP
jgi:hypothetical protein